MKKSDIQKWEERYLDPVGKSIHIHMNIVSENSIFPLMKLDFYNIFRE
jgi:hypothetical protein